MCHTLPEEAVKAAQNAIRTANWEYGITDADMAKALTAAIPHLPQGLGVKNLEWKTERADKMNGVDTERTGFHEFGYYSITGQKGCYYVSTFDNMGRMRHVGHHGFASIEAAKAAAQTDYEARVLSAIEPAPSPRAQALEEAARIADAYIGGEYEAQGCAAEQIAAAIRVLSSPDHADAGKVEGDGWLPIESAPRDGTVIQVWHQVHKCPISVLWKDDGFPYRGKRLNWYERTYTTAWPEHVFFYWRPLPSAPASEGAE